MFRKSFSELTRRAKTKRLKSHSTCQRNESELTDPQEEKRFVDVSSTVDVGDPFCHVPNLPLMNDSEWCLNFDQGPLSDSDVESDDDSDEFYHHLNELESFKKSLHKWYSSFDISQDALSALLSILKPHKCFRSLPTDPRTLVDSPTKFIVSTESSRIGERYSWPQEGRDTKSLTANLLRRLVTDDVEEQYSLTGKTSQTGLVKQPFEKTETYKVILDVCYRTYGVNQESVVREAISDWLMQAKYRRIRREKRMSVPAGSLLQCEDGESYF